MSNLSLMALYENVKARTRCCGVCISRPQSERSTSPASRLLVSVIPSPARGLPYRTAGGVSLHCSYL